MINNLKVEEERMSTNQLISLELDIQKFDLLMGVYEKALNQVFDTLLQVKAKLYSEFSYDIINNISRRIKTPESIIDKMKKKHYDIDFKNIIENINDVAGVRITCPVKNDIYTILNIIEKLSNLEIIERKDYLSKPKKSGYSGYHIIVETPVKVEGKIVPVKVEIQIRTMAMDFWATNEHKVRYKSNKKLSILDSKRLTAYAKIINIIDEKIMEIYHKQELA